MRFLRKNSSGVGLRHAPPKAAAMVESLRGLGYSTWTALADLIDNSIAAGADKVDVSFRWPDSGAIITVTDNGRGMTPTELDVAMRLGERSPLDNREAHDLGRFGMGLKTASFSQCRRLTVASRTVASYDCLRWDLDVLAESSGDGWYMLEGPAEGSELHLRHLDGLSSGTVVLWEQLDRVVTSGFNKQEFLDLVDRVEQHLAMVFHRYLGGHRRRLSLSLNGNPVEAWDPFLISDPATYSSPVDRIPTAVGDIELQGHVLPHKDRLNEAEHRNAGGPDGWTAQQGFYVYRNERLLVDGDWLGLGRNRAWTKEQAHQLARIRVDIPNSADYDWKIDVRKSVARPPVYIRQRLIALAEDIRERARRVFAHRGQAVRIGEVPIKQAWRSEHFGGNIRYRIDEDHTVVRAVLDSAGDLEPQVRAMLRVIEETVPIQRIWLDSSESHESPRTAFAGEPAENVRAILITMFRNLTQRKGLSPGAAKKQLLTTEPFHNYGRLIAELPDDLCEQENPAE